MSRLSLPLAFATLLTVGQDEACPNEKDDLYTTFEGSTVVPDRFGFGGVLDSGARFALSIEKSQGRWHFHYRTGKVGTKFHLSADDRDIHGSRTQIVSMPGGSATRLIIEFGAPMVECFGNGIEVYRHVSITISGRKITRAYERNFTQCQSVYQQLRVSQAGGSHAVGDGIQ